MKPVRAAAITAVSMLLTASATFVGVQAFADEGAGTSATNSAPSEISRPSVPTDDDGKLEARPATDADADAFAEAYRKASTPLGECPEAVKFFRQDDVATFYRVHFGYSEMPKMFFVGGCPPVSVLEEGLANAKKAVARGEVR